ncbi:MAG: hypothetical protein ABI847_20950 [Anaerolineales bacterium]
MQIETQNPDPKQPLPQTAPRPYTKPAVERIPLAEAKGQFGPNASINDLQSLSS